MKISKKGTFDESSKEKDGEKTITDSKMNEPLKSGE